MELQAPHKPLYCPDALIWLDAAVSQVSLRHRSCPLICILETFTRVISMARWLAEYREGMWEVYILNWEEQTGSVNNLKKKKILEMLKGNMGSRNGLWKQKQACACWWDWSMREKQSLDAGERNWLHTEAFVYNWILNLWLEGIYERGGTEDVLFTLFIIVSTHVHLSLLWSQTWLIYNIHTASVFRGFILFPKAHWLILSSDN